VSELARIGFGVRAPAGTYYVCADFAQFGYGGEDIAFCRHLIEDVGVAAIPPSFFYDRPERRRGYVRFAFCKKMDTLKAAVERLKRLVPASSPSGTGSR
jgi:aspartate/methionine/tyrosine aminotransferase